MKPENDTLSERVYGDERWSLFDLLDIVRRRWRLVFGISLAIPLISVSVAAFWPKQYESIALIQPASRGHLTGPALGSHQGPQLLSPVDGLIHWFNSAAFRAKISEVLRTNVTVRAYRLKDSNLIEVQLRAPTKELAEYGVKSVAEIVTNYEADSLQRIEAGLRTVLSSTIIQLEDTRAMIDKLRPQLEKARTDQAQDSARGDPEFSHLFIRQEALKNRKGDLEIALLPQNKRQTELIGGISTSDGPVIPNFIIVALLGTVVGVCLGLLVVITKHFYSKIPAAPNLDADKA